VSFHCIPTFPENNYGYVTLPTMEADKIKKKLNGSILKGRKFKVEVSRPQKRHRDEDESGPVTPAAEPPSGKKSKKQKAEGNILEGYELPPDRQVKRGWTESTSSMKERCKEEKRKKRKDERKEKSQAKSKYTEKPECLFRAKVPPNRASADQEEQSKKKKRPSQESVVHEFAKTIKQPSFIRTNDDGAAPTYTFEEGKGWIDSSGNLKEPVSDRIRSDQYRPGKVAGAKERPKRAKYLLTAQESSRELRADGIDGKDTLKPAEDLEDWTSSSGATSSDDSTADSKSEESLTSDSSDESDVAASGQDEQSIPRKVEKLSDSETNLDQNESQTEGNNEPRSEEVHPLEALFKKPASTAAESKPDPDANAQFSFFGQGDVESEEELQAADPQTPFTKNDLQGRGLRSAAPTPDTALVGRNKKWSALDQDDSMDVDDELFTNTPISKSESDLKIESEFMKWFWENRGDNNRAWKKRRRDAAKEERQRENRRKGMKGKS
jgi:hypothetical protein